MIWQLRHGNEVSVSAQQKLFPGICFLVLIRRDRVLFRGIKAAKLNDDQIAPRSAFQQKRM